MSLPGDPPVRQTRQVNRGAPPMGQTAPQQSRQGGNNRTTPAEGGFYGGGGDYRKPPTPPGQAFPRGWGPTGRIDPNSQNQTTGAPWEDLNGAPAPPGSTHQINHLDNNFQSFEPWQGGGGSGAQVPMLSGDQGYGPGGGAPGNFGQPMNPWDMSYGGQFTAPMSPYEQGALNDYAGFVGGGQGLGGGQKYLEDVLGGQYLDLNRNPYLQQIQQGAQGTKDYQDSAALKRIQSQMAAGGNAMSGASLGAQSDYLGQSNNQFQMMMGNLMNQNYARERGSMDMAPAGLRANAGQVGQGYGQAFQMGGLPRQLQQNDLNSQYGDWLRQTGAMRDDFRYPDTLTQQLLYGGGYRGQTPNQYGSSTGDMLAGAAGGIDWGSILGGLGGLFANSGGSSGGGYGGDYGNDGVRLGYDAAPPPTGPRGYWDTNYYNQALTDANAKSAAAAQAAAAGKNNMAPALIALLMQMLGGGKKGGSKASFGGGSGPSGNKTDSNKGPNQPYQQGPRQTNESSDFARLYGNTLDPGMNSVTSPYGLQFPVGPGTDFTENSSFYQTDPSLPNIPFQGGTPGNPWDIYPDGGAGADPFAGGGGSGGGMPSDWYGGDLNVPEMPMDTGGGDWGGDWS